MLCNRRFGSFMRLGMIGLLALRSGLFTSALKTTQMFAPISDKYPEVAQAMKAETHVKDMVNKLLTETSLLRNYSDNDRMRQMEEFHLPTYLYVKTMLQRFRTKEPSKPLFLGISAPQGCGKTTLTSILVELCRIEGIKCVAMSLDDFYLPGQKQDQLAGMYSHNKLLEFRGNAGTHDLHLAMTTFHSLMNMNVRRNSDGSTQPVLIPRYDKSLRQGRGDRAEKDQWTVIDEPVDVVLMEGWTLGFDPLPHIPLPVDPRSLLNTTTGSSSNTAAVDAQGHDSQQMMTVGDEDVKAFEVAYAKARSIKEVNDLLRPYEALNWLMDAWLVLAVQDVHLVYQWRLQAEQQMREAGKSGLTDEQVSEFVSRFMPAYATYLPGLYKEGPQRGSARPELLVPVAGSSSGGASKGSGISASGPERSPVLKVTVGEDRLPTSVEVM